MADPLATTPAAIPPPGVRPNLIDPPSGAPVLIIVSTILLAIMLAFAGVRFYVKIKIRRKLTADDWTTLAAVIGTLCYYAICVFAVTRAKIGTHIWDISVARLLSNDSLVASFLVNWPSGLVWAFAKSSFFLLYLQIFGPLRWLRICVYIGLVTNWLFYVIVVIAGFVYQVPNPGQSWLEGTKNPRYHQSFPWTIPTASGSLILDTYIFVLPVIAILKLQLQVRKKLGVLAVFATGFLACIASSIGIYFRYLLSMHSNDTTYWIYPVLLTGLVEMCIGITCNCMPSTVEFFKSDNGIWNSRGGSSLGSLMRGLLSRRKSSDGTGHSSNSWRKVDSHLQLVGGNHFVDVHGGQNDMYELTDGNGRREIHVRRDFEVV